MKKKIAVLACGWSHYYVTNFIKGLKRAAENKNIDIYFFNSYNYVEFSGYPNFTGYSVFNLINYAEYDGIIVLADLITNPRILEKERLKIIKSGKPAISINRRLEGITCIREDNYSGIYEIMTHLIKDHGITDFSYIGGKESSSDFAERYKAYRTALLDNNIKIDINKVYTVPISSYSYAYNHFKDFIKTIDPLPQVFVCANDLMAYAMLKICNENNIKVPEQVKIVGYDDLFYSKNTKPALTTVRSNSEQIGYEALTRILAQENQTTEVQMLKIKNQPIYRQSCGCQNELPNTKTDYTIQILDNVNQNEEFSTQIEQIEEIFTEASDVFTLLTNLEIFFNKSHHFEGRDFCIFLKSDWTSVLINSEENLPQNLSYGTQVQSIVSIQNDKKYSREVINTSDLIPTKFLSEENNFYHFMPIFNHLYVHGYYVSKNDISLIENHFGYTWSRNFGTNIERFRKKNMYKQMSQQFLKLSTKDALSGLINRVGLEKLAKPFYSQNKRNGLTSVLFFVDINKMKHINDQFGHLHGDLAVKTVAAAISETIPKNWLAIRYGGDEFLIVGNSKNYNGEDYCQLITQRLERKTSVMHLPYNLSASVGTYSVPPNSELTLEQAVEKVDEIMYKKKQDFHKTH